MSLKYNYMSTFLRIRIHVSAKFLAIFNKAIIRNKLHA